MARNKRRKGKLKRVKIRRERKNSCKVGRKRKESLGWKVFIPLLCLFLVL